MTGGNCFKFGEEKNRREKEHACLRFLGREEAEEEGAGHYKTKEQG